MKTKVKTGKSFWINKRFTKEQLDNIRNSDGNLSIKEICDYLSINRATLWRWTKKDLIPQYYIEGKKFYLKQDILNSLQRHSSKPKK